MTKRTTSRWYEVRYRLHRAEVPGRFRAIDRVCSQDVRAASAAVAASRVQGPNAEVLTVRRRGQARIIIDRTATARIGG
jgi:hypothetical protein